MPRCVDKGRNPAEVGIIWAIKLIVGETKAEAEALRERLIENVPPEAVAVWLSHNTGFDMSTLPARFTLGYLQQAIVTANASPVGVVGLLLREHGPDAEITREEFMAHGLRAATGYSATYAGTAAQLADILEERFEASGSRGGFMIGHSQDANRDLLLRVNGLLIPELQRSRALSDALCRQEFAGEPRRITGTFLSRNHCKNFHVITLILPA